MHHDLKIDITLRICDSLKSTEVNHSHLTFPDPAPDAAGMAAEAEERLLQSETPLEATSDPSNPSKNSKSTLRAQYEEKRREVIK